LKAPHLLGEMILYELVESLKFFSFVIPANPGSGSGAGAGIQQIHQVLDAPGLLHAGAGLSKPSPDLIQGPACLCVA
jgi:hypothetical protein